MDLASDLMALRFLIEIRYGDSGVAPLITEGERSNLRLSVIATGICRQHGWSVCRLQWEQSVASRLERHQTHSAKNDGKSISPAINPGEPRSPGFLFVRPAWAHTCGCKSRCKLVTVSKVKRNCVRVTERGKEAWSVNREPMNKNRIEGAAKQGE
jgi:hypothetical protein